jgi:hypothetical protein
METLKIWFEYHEISDALRVHIDSRNMKSMGGEYTFTVSVIYG